MSEVQTRLVALREQSQKSLKVTGPAIIAGEAKVQGSKNAANKLVAVTVGLPGRYEIHNFPLILDSLELLNLVEFLGGSVTIDHNNIVVIDSTGLKNTPIPYELTKTTTGAFGFAGALLGRFGQVNIGKPGGDDIGPRPVDLHSDGFRALGAVINEHAETIQGHLPAAPKGQRFALRLPSTGAAVNILLAAAAAHGQVSVENSPIDGDMDAMYGMLRAAGIGLETKDNIVNLDATSYRPTSETIRFTCSPDRNDAFTWLAYGALSTEGLRIHNLSLPDMAKGLSVLDSLQIQIRRESSDTVFVQAPKRGLASGLDTIIVAGLAREFHSDWAPLLEVVLTTLQGSCRVIDTLFANRVRQAELLREMGANVHIGGGQPPAGVSLHFSTDPIQARYIIDIQGPTKLRPITTEVGYDVRACAALVMAASQAKGESHLSQIQALFRGYEDVVERLQAIGIAINVL